MDKEDLWGTVSNRCLSQANALLNSETAPTAATVETVRQLVETAISIDMLNLRWAEQSRYGAAVFPDRTSGRPKKEISIMSEDFERYKAELLEWRGISDRVVDYIMERARQSGQLSAEEFAKLEVLAMGRD